MKSNIISPELLNQRLYFVLEKMRRSLGLSHPKWSELLQVTTKDYEKNYTHKSFKISALSIFNLANCLGISVEQIIKGNINYVTLEKHFHGELNHLSERYDFQSTCKMRSASNILNFIHLNFGFEFKRSIMSHLQLNETLLSDLSRPINFLLILDMLSFIKRTGLSENTFYKMGLNSISFNRSLVNDSVADINAFKSQKIFYEYFADNIAKNIEQNFTYDLIKSTDNFAIVHSKPTQQLKDFLKTNTPGNAEVCAIRGGVIASVKGFLNHPFAKVSHTSCLHSGDYICKFEINYEEYDGNQINNYH